VYVAVICTGCVFTDVALAAAFRGGILEEASVAGDGVVPSSNGSWLVCKKGDLLQNDQLAVTASIDSALLWPA
jgi:hypothetical protein